MWVGLALITMFPIVQLLQGAIPIFTVVWLIVPLLIVFRTRDVNGVGFLRIPWRGFLVTAALNFSALLFVSIVVEPWSHSYQALVNAALSGTPPDTTFAWLIRFKGITAWSSMLFYSGSVTLFGEELFFRGWLLQWLQRRMDNGWAIMVQATLFTLPQLIAVVMLSPLQSIIYTVFYSWLAVGVVGGWAAVRTRSIWPSLASVTVWNTIMIFWTISGG